MPYISVQEVKNIRNALKKALPDCKFSVRGGNQSSLYVTIIEGPLQISGDYECVNQWHYENHHEDNPKVIETIREIYKTIGKCKEQEEIVYDSDYGSVPSFYIRLSIGEWKKPFISTII